MIREHVGDGSRYGLEVAYSFDGQRLLGTAGALRHARHLLGDGFSERLELWRQAHGILQAPAFVNPISDAEAHQQRKLLGRDLANGRYRVAQEARSVLERASIFVGALVGDGREELVKKITVGGVNLDDLHAGGERAAGGGHKGGGNAGDAGLIQRLRNNGIAIEGQRTGSVNGLPAAILGASANLPSHGAGVKAFCPA